MKRVILGTLLCILLIGLPLISGYAFSFEPLTSYVFYIGEEVYLPSALNPDLANSGKPISFELYGPSDGIESFDGKTIKANKETYFFLEITVKDYWGTNSDYIGSVRLFFVEKPLEYQTLSLERDTGSTMFIQEYLPMSFKTRWQSYNRNITPVVDPEKYIFTIKDAGTTQAKMYDGQSYIYFPYAGTAVINCVWKDGMGAGKDCTVDLVVTVEDVSQGEIDVSGCDDCDTKLATYTTQPLNSLLCEHNPSFCKKIWSIKDPGVTGAVIEDGNLFATNPGEVIITATVKDAFGKGKDYQKDIKIIVEDRPGKVAVDGAEWDYFTGKLLKGSPAPGAIYDASTHTLKLSNVKATEVYCDHDLRVQLTGKNVIDDVWIHGNNGYWESEIHTHEKLGGKVEFFGDGELNTLQITACGGIISLDNTHVNADAIVTTYGLQNGKLYVNNSTLISELIYSGSVRVDGKDSYVESTEEGFRLDTVYLIGPYEDRYRFDMIVSGGTVIANSFGPAYSTVSVDSNSDVLNLMPMIDPAYTEARVWMGSSEDDANRRGPLPQSMLTSHNYKNYIRIAPLEAEETPQPETPVIPVTGDNLPLMLLLSMFFGCGIAVVLTIFQKKQLCRR